MISLNPMLFKNIAHVGFFKHFVFVYLRNCVFVYLYLIYGNVIFDTLETHVFSKIEHMLGLLSTLESEEFGSLSDPDKH